MDDQTIALFVKILGFSYMLFERWLGRTSKVKANSSLDLIADAGSAMIKIMQIHMAKKKALKQLEGEDSCNSKK
jgi:hypothetical protein